jgi:hypothetical protein
MRLAILDFGAAFFFWWILHTVMSSNFWCMENFHCGSLCRKNRTLCLKHDETECLTRVWCGKEA